MHLALRAQKEPFTLFGETADRQVVPHLLVAGWVPEVLLEEQLPVHLDSLRRFGFCGPAANFALASLPALLWASLFGLGFKGNWRVGGFVPTGLL